MPQRHHLQRRDAVGDRVSARPQSVPGVPARARISGEPQRPVVPYFTCGAELKAAGADVFCVAGQLDVVIADDVIGQQFAPGSPVTDRVFSTDAGIRLARRRR